jgi:hypothetical protein
VNSSLENLRRDLLATVADMSGEQLNWHPQGKWCTGEILEHLHLTYTGTIKGLEKVLASGQPLVTPPSIRQRLSVVVVVGFGHMPEGRTAPEKSRPKGIAAEEVRQQIGKTIMQMDTMITQCQSRFGTRVPLMNHSILGPLTAPQWRKFHVVHGRHHHKQILNLQEQMRPA